MYNNYKGFITLLVMYQIRTPGTELFLEEISLIKIILNVLIKGGGLTVYICNLRDHVHDSKWDFDILYSTLFSINMQDESKLYIFLELITKGSLRSLYQRYTLRDSQVSGYTRQILLGLKYLHEQNVIHRYSRFYFNFDLFLFSFMYEFMFTSFLW